MPNYRRWHGVGGCYFFTIVTYDRRRIFDSSEAVDLLRKAVADVRSDQPFDIDAAVVLPDHAHFVWQLPPGDVDYSKRIGRIKATFTKLLKESPLNIAVHRGAQHGYSTVWQPRFWEHVIRDQDDYNRHVEYTLYNPVRHEYVQCPHQWNHSSFASWVRKGWLLNDWYCQCAGRTVTPPDFEDIALAAGE